MPPHIVNEDEFLQMIERIKGTGFWMNQGDRFLK